MMTLLTLLQATPDVAISDMEALQKFSLKLFSRLLIDFLSVAMLIGGVYYRVHKRKELFFTFFIFNLVIFLICFLLNKVDLSMGAAFGLFAVFSMLRYRTEDVGIKDMSYLFLVIAMGLINAITKVKDANDLYEYVLLLVINAIIIAIAWLLDSGHFFETENMQSIAYDNLELTKAVNRDLLIEDIKQRTGIEVKRVTIGKIDLTKNTVNIKVYY